MGPVVIIGKFILGQAPFLEFVLDFFGHTRVVGHKPKQAFLIIFMLFDDLFPALITGFRIIIIHPNIVTAKGAVVVGIRFPVGNDIEFLKPLPPASIENSDQKLVLGRVIIVRPGKGDPVVRMIGHTGPEAIGLYFMITFALFPGMLSADSWKE